MNTANNPIDEFKGRFHFLSNFYPSPITFEGISYPTVEHAFQASKVFDPVKRLECAQLETPGKAKRWGRRVSLRSDWEDVKESVMLDCLTSKFEDTIMRDLLIQTAPRILIEGNTHGDQYWGQQNSQGKNRLGILLMQVRSTLISEQEMGLNNNDNSSERLPPTITKQRESKGLIFEEIDQDLFALEDSWSLAHCVSVDLRMGAGIAVMFREKFGQIDKLRQQNADVGGIAILNYPTRSIYYLVTKPYYYDKPSIESLRQSLETMRSSILQKRSTGESELFKLAMPRIGCGLDGLQWTAVSQLLKEIFSYDLLHILICTPSNLPSFSKWKPQRKSKGHS